MADRCAGVERRRAPFTIARHKAQIFEAVDRLMRKACPWLRTGGVVDHQMVDITVGDAGLGKGRGAGDAWLI